MDTRSWCGNILPTSKDQVYHQWKISGYDV